MKLAGTSTRVKHIDLNLRKTSSALKICSWAALFQLDERIGRLIFEDSANPGSRRYRRPQEKQTQHNANPLQQWPFPIEIMAKFIEVRVKPNSAASLLQQDATGQWNAQLKSPPVDGKANAELIALIAKQFGCRKSDVTIKSGASGRIKLVKIEGVE